MRRRGHLGKLNRSEPRTPIRVPPERVGRRLNARDVAADRFLGRIVAICLLWAVVANLAGVTMFMIRDGPADSLRRGRSSSPSGAFSSPRWFSRRSGSASSTAVSRPTFSRGSGSSPNSLPPSSEWLLKRSVSPARGIIPWSSPTRCWPSRAGGHWRRPGRFGFGTAVGGLGHGSVEPELARRTGPRQSAGCVLPGPAPGADRCGVSAGGTACGVVVRRSGRGARMGVGGTGLKGRRT